MRTEKAYAQYFYTLKGEFIETLESLDGNWCERFVGGKRVHSSGQLVHTIRGITYPILHDYRRYFLGTEIEEDEDHKGRWFEMEKGISENTKTKDMIASWNAFRIHVESANM